MSVRCVSIRLKIPDNEAFTALATLQRLNVCVAHLERSDVWLLETDEKGGEFLDAVRANEMLFNPNTHELVELAQPHPRAGEVWVEELGEDPGLRARLGGKMISGVRSAKRLSGWRLFTQTGVPAEDSILKSAADVLLCNPAIERALT